MKRASARLQAGAVAAREAVLPRAVAVAVVE